MARRIASASVSTGFQTTSAGHVAGVVERARRPAGDCSATCCERLLAVQALAAGEEPDLAAVRTGAVIGGSSVVAVRRRSGSGRRARRCRACAMGTGSPSWRARCTVRATSSRITAALTAAAGVAPIGERRRGCASAPPASGEPRSVSTMPRPIESSPMSANGPTGIVAAELVGHHRQHARDRLAAGRPGGGVGRVGVHDARRPRACAGRRRRARRCRTDGRALALDEVAVEVAHDHRRRRSARRRRHRGLITSRSAPGTRAETLPAVQTTRP